MDTETELCNLALSRLGARRLTDLDSDDTLEAEHCNLHYDQVRDSLLRSFPWPFAQKRAELDQTEVEEEVVTPDFGWAYMFDLPTDYLRMDELYEQEHRYVIEGGKLLTDETSASIVYTAQITTTTSFDPLFTELLSIELAIALCMPLTQDKTLRDRLLDERSIRRREARQACAFERPKQRKQSWLESRTGVALEFDNNL